MSSCFNRGFRFQSLFTEEVRKLQKNGGRAKYSYEDTKKKYEGFHKEGRWQQVVLMKVLDFRVLQKRTDGGRYRYRITEKTRKKIKFRGIV